MAKEKIRAKWVATELSCPKPGVMGTVECVDDERNADNLAASIFDATGYSESPGIGFTIETVEELIENGE